MHSSERLQSQEVPSKEKRGTPTGEWKYITVSPRKYAIDAADVGYPVGHRFGFRKRTSKLTGKSESQWYCSCGDRSNEWITGTKAYIRRIYEKEHISLLMQQHTLF
jgi:hypothetical protein